LLSKGGDGQDRLTTPGKTGGRPGKTGDSPDRRETAFGRPQARRRKEWAWS
jgi:hypothetical protein